MYGQNMPKPVDDGVNLYVDLIKELTQIADTTYDPSQSEHNHQVFAKALKWIMQTLRGMEPNVRRE